MSSFTINMNPFVLTIYTFPGGSVGKESACHCRRPRFDPWVGPEDPLEKAMATYSSILAWEIPWIEEPGELQSMGSQRVRRD